METSIDLYEITPKDRPFLEKLRKSVKMKELYPDKNITNQEYARWQEMLDYALDKAFNPNKKCIIATKNKKPCGIITFEPKMNSFYLDCICTWPVETAKKVVLAGQTLFKQLFTEFLKSKTSAVNLAAINNGPFSVVPKYAHLGFKQTGGENHLTTMRINRERAENTLKKLDDIIITIPSENSEDLDLFRELIV